MEKKQVRPRHGPTYLHSAARIHFTATRTYVRRAPSHLSWLYMYVRACVLQVCRVCLSDCHQSTPLSYAQRHDRDMQSGSTAVSFGAMSAGHGQNLLGAGAGGDDDPTRYPPSAFKSVHQLDAAVEEDEDVPAAKRQAGGGQFSCPICDRAFGTEKGVHGHMRCHYDRQWRGMEPPKPPPLVMAADGQLYRYVCPRCRAPFHSRQALGGHRASHSGKKGCFWLALEELAAAAAQETFAHAFDLNVPLPVEEEEEENDDN